MSLFGSMSGHTSKEVYSGESGFETYGLIRRHPASQLHLHMPEQRAHATVRAYAHIRKLVCNEAYPHAVK
jgi:hypothetical protein